MNQLKTINNYLVFHNGTIESQVCNDDIIFEKNNVTVKQAVSLQIVYLIDQEGEYQFDLNINGELELIEIYDIKTDAVLNKKISIYENSKLLRYVDNQSIDNIKTKISEDVAVAKNADIRCAYVELSNSNVDLDINYSLNEPEAKATVRLASLAKKDEQKHVTIAISHDACYTTGIMDNYGVVKDAASLVIDGIGTIHKGNHQSNSHQTNKIIVFDEKCNAKANPYLYIDEYDVKASHGASVGKIDENHLYYLQSRGLSRQEAMHLVTYGYFIPVLEFIDNDELDVNRMLDVLRLNDGGQSSCPSPNDYLRELDEAEYSFIITITSKLSGSFNSACVARTMCKNPEHVFVIDSKGTAGSIVLIAEKLFELIKENKEFSVITNEITAFRNSVNLLFALDCFDNLVRNGRMSKLTAFIAEKIAIKPLCYADDGEIKIKEKIRTFRGVIKRMTHYIGKMCEDTTNKICIIAHTRNESAALELKKDIEENYHFKEVRVMENRGLCAFYALEGGLIVTF